MSKKWTIKRLLQSNNIINITVMQSSNERNPQQIQSTIKNEAHRSKQQELQQLQVQLKTLQEKCDLQSKKIKLYRKENEEIKHALAKQAQIDTGLLLNSKELSDANTKLEAAIRDISLKLEISLESTNVVPTARAVKPVSLVTIQHTTVTEETEEVDLPSQGIVDEDIILLLPFKGLKSLLLGENKIGDEGLLAITTSLLNVTKLQLNSNCFSADALKKIGNLKSLKVLDIRNNKLGDGCMEYLSTLNELVQLSVSKNSISDEGVKKLSNLKGLVYLDLTTNLVTDIGAEHLLGLTKLTHLYLMSNRITSKSVYAFFESLTSLEVLDVRFNINEAATKQQLRASKPSKIQLFC